MSKYDPLQKALKTKDVTEWRPTFKDIEAILGFKLPASAYKRSEWWSNNRDGHAQSRAWLDAGWRTEKVDTSERKVTFRKAKPGGRRGGRDDRPSIFGCLKGTVHVPPGVDLTEPTGVVWNAEQGKLYE